MRSLPRFAVRPLLVLTLVLTGFAACGEDAPGLDPAETRSWVPAPMETSPPPTLILPTSREPAEPLIELPDDPAAVVAAAPGADPGQLPPMRRCRLNVLECQAMESMLPGEGFAVTVWACACGVFSSSCEDSPDGKRSCSCMLDGRPMPTQECFATGDPL